MLLTVPFNSLTRLWTRPCGRERLGPGGALGTPADLHPCPRVRHAVVSGGGCSTGTRVLDTHGVSGQVPGFLTEQETAEGTHGSTAAMGCTRAKNLGALTGPGGNQDGIWGVVG